ncbi:MAG TPA: hypothetical protein VN962_05415 [Polyangia bacterium]|nr:hypothetical protein [Polyangia bacterium]
MNKLTPKQKKIAAGVAVGGVLALFVLISRRGQSGGQDATANQVGGTGLPADYGSALTGGSFADNGASAGQLASAVTDLTGALGQRFDQQEEIWSGALADQGAGIAAANEALRNQLQGLSDRVGQLTTPSAAAGQPAGLAAAVPSNPAAAPPTAAPSSVHPNGTSGSPQSTGPATVKLASGATVAVGSIVQKPSASHGGRLSNFRVNSNGSLSWVSIASGH